MSDQKSIKNGKSLPEHELRSYYEVMTWLIGGQIPESDATKHLGGPESARRKARLLNMDQSTRRELMALPDPPVPFGKEEDLAYSLVHYTSVTKNAFNDLIYDMTNCAVQTLASRPTKLEPPNQRRKAVRLCEVQESTNSSCTAIDTEGEPKHYLNESAIKKFDRRSLLKKCGVLLCTPAPIIQETAKCVDLTFWIDSPIFSFLYRIETIKHENKIINHVEFNRLLDKYFPEDDCDPYGFREAINALIEYGKEQEIMDSMNLLTVNYTANFSGS